MCLSLQKGNSEQANVVGFLEQQAYQVPHSYQGQPPHQRLLDLIQPRYNSQYSVFNLGWQPHPNFNYATTTQNTSPSIYNRNLPFHQNRQPQAYQSQPPPPKANTSCQRTTLEDLVKAMAITQS